MIKHSCGAEWASPNAAHCATCCLTFRSASGFDAHRVAGRCLTRDELRAKGYEPNGAGLWRLPRTMDVAENAEFVS